MKADARTTKTPLEHLNPLRWSGREFLLISIVLLLAVACAESLREFWPSIIAIQTVSGFLLLAIMPGYAILRALRLSRLRPWEGLGYAAAASIMGCFGIGVLLTLLGAVGILPNPISFWPLFITYGVVQLTLALLTFRMPAQRTRFVAFAPIHAARGLFYLVVLLLFTTGAQFAFDLQPNYLLLTALLLSAVAIVLAAHERFFPSESHSILLYVVGLGLLYQGSFLTGTLAEWADGTFEVWTAHQTLARGYWDFSAFGNLEAMLSLVILLPTYSLLLNQDLIVVLKFAFPLLYALVGVILYEAAKKMVPNWVALLGAFFFLAFFPYSSTMLGLYRQQVAELFIAIFLLAIVDSRLPRSSKILFAILSTFGVALSHYATAYIFIFALAGGMGIRLLAQKIPTLRTVEHSVLRPGFVLMAGTFTLTWYLYTSGSSNLDSAIRIGDRIASSLISEFLNTDSTQGLAIVLAAPKTPLGQIYKVVHFASFALIGLGLIAGVIGPRRLPRDYIALSVPLLALDAAGIVVPYVASAINTTRLYHLTLLVLAVYVPLGLQQLWHFWRKVRPQASIQPSGSGVSGRVPLVLSTVFIFIYFAFNSGIAYEVAGEHNTIPLAPTAIEWAHFSAREERGAAYINDNTAPTATVRSDAFTSYLIQATRGQYLPYRGVFTAEDEPAGDYTLLGEDTVRWSTIRLDSPTNSRLSTHVVPLESAGLQTTFSQAHLTYDNGGARVLYHEEAAAP